MKRIRLGMVGGGVGAFIGGVHRIAARIDDQYELIAGALNSDPIRSLESAKQLGISAERSYSSYQEMAQQEAQRSDGIEVVSIVTPNNMHFPIAKAFLEAGIHVICDKPMTCTLQEAEELNVIATQSNRLFVLTHNYTAYPMVRQARQMIQEGKLGKLRLVQVEYIQDWMTTSTEKTGNKQAKWRTDPAQSGNAGCLGDIGTHAYNLARFISDLQLEQVSADLSTFVENRLLDDNVHAMLRFEQGVKGMLWTSQVAPGHENGLKIRIYGSEGGIEWEQEHPNLLTFHPFGQPTQLLTRAGHGYQSPHTHLTRIPAGHPEGYLEGFANLYLETAQVIRQLRQSNPINEPIETRLLPNTQDGVEGLQFITAMIHSSHNNGKWTKLENANELT
ncbi:Gfo/Idh/MocA family oxidoreductase [Vibrio sp. TH_r3]|uniref:Gfo/Idh/MocA family protein n=1 Tax=Vibrio sp. TH_r3 TaxID=3082084 RepID=UPI00295351EA|nr:Gfo/Idh/MocA family oxidoreductase [Vibrio sp. TH_r3]MDV7105545.1 Gfo/Idh/MocA family oxidoreductase [Vibrio sp. TH_r3]